MRDGPGKTWAGEGAIRETLMLIDLALARCRAHPSADEEAKALIGGALEAVRQEIAHLGERAGYDHPYAVDRRGPARRGGGRERV